MAKDWSKLEKISDDPDKWLEMYADYQKLLLQSDTGDFWHEQYLMANSERNSLRQQLNSKQQ